MPSPRARKCSTLNIFPKPLVLFDERQIPEENRQHSGDEEQEHHDAVELVPDAGVDARIDVHAAQLIRRPGATEAKICTGARKNNLPNFAPRTHNLRTC